MSSRRLCLAALALALSASAAHADSTVSALTAASALTGPELFYCVQSAADRKCTATQLQTFIGGGGTTIGTSTITGGTSGNFLYNNAGIYGERTPTQTTAVLIPFSTSTTAQGVVPGSNGAAATSFLNATGAWSVPAGGSGGVTIGATITGSCTSGFNLYSNAGVIGCQANGGGGLPIIGTGATVTASAPLLDLSQTFNNAAVTFTGIRTNFTNTASAAASKLFDFQVGGGSFMYASTDGAVTISQQTAATSSFALTIIQQGATIATFSSASSGLSLYQNLVLANGVGQAINWGGGALLYEDVAFILGQRNGANAQGFRVYNTADTGTGNPTNYERAVLDWTTTGSTFTVGTQMGGTGLARPMMLVQTGLYSAAGTALPTCVAGLKGARTVVSDATAPTYNANYASGGAITANVLCNGSNWVTQ